MPRPVLLFVLALAGTAWLRVAATEYRVTTYYSEDMCIGSPHNIFVIEDANCSAAPCMTADTQRSTQCTSDYITTMRETFQGDPYVLAEFFDDSNCSKFSFAEGFLARGQCEASTNSTALGFNYTNFVIVDAYNNIATVEFFNRAKACYGDSYYTATIDMATLESHACDGNGHRWYSSNDDGSTSGSTSSGSGGIHLSSGEIVAICIGCLAVVLLVLILRCVFCKRITDTKEEESMQTDYTRSS